MPVSSDLASNVDVFNKILENYIACCEKNGFQFPVESKDAFYRGVMEQYSEYAETHPILVTNFDPLKIYGWAPFIARDKLAEVSDEQTEVLFNSSAWCMTHFLYKGTGTLLDPKWIAKLIVIARASFAADKESVSIAKVGFYAGFRSSKETSLVKGLAEQNRFVM